MTRTLIVDDASASSRPMVHVVDNFARNHKLGNLLEARVGKGSLLACMMDLPHIRAQQTEAVQVLRGNYQYVASPSLRPSQMLAPELLDRLFAFQ